MSGGALQLRPAYPLDAGRIGAIMSDFIDQTDWMPRVHTRAEEIAFADRLIALGWTQVALLEGRVAGFLSRDGAEVVALYLATTARRRGIGRRLIEAAQAETDRLSLWCFQANAAARSFYLALGFHEAARSDGAGNDEGLPDIQFLWQGGPTNA
ncbi:GNAT family N-acetyltransferase [Pseudooceanicola sp.]|uniref:GNAT family N-acetyltransferase n=1 Tax=Pseudooceanicola sp. TaxID=1914328 RepID=UPI0026133A99|nr:GNAT family N-acetyltransferase [Pseudooceanicola sp.]MDF1854352.1 GNAT family N-acetyltransferase [Pseudooceanicola sp.]